MELRVLQYFLAITREQNILRATESLNLSQPTLSRQIRDMEAELGKQLFIRGNRSITLTEEGMILRKRAEEIMALVKKAENEISLVEEPVAGDITVGGWGDGRPADTGTDSAGATGGMAGRASSCGQRGQVLCHRAVGRWEAPLALSL